MYALMKTLEYYHFSYQVDNCFEEFWSMFLYDQDGAAKQRTHNSGFFNYFSPIYGVLIVFSIEFLFNKSFLFILHY